MVCPLRFVLVGVSAAVAVAVALNTSWGADEVSDSPENDALKEDARKEDRKVSRFQSFRDFFRLIIDMFTGRYLFQLWKMQQKGKVV
mmetsp:Transcript_16052/g.38056  ORF Transcript_16052/g.38056 Transcript_16052/m.38056 type:complete len:87 (-) Transcript_16052:603-863(-)